MSNNLESDRSVSTGKMYPIDLAPQKITIVKGVANSDVKMAHLISGQTKTSGSSQHGPHASQTTGIMRSSLAQIISSNSTSQPQMIVSGSPILQGSQILSQGTQLHSGSPQIISQSQLITPSGQIISPGTQIISQGTQLSAQVVTSNSGSSGGVQASVASASGAQVLSMGSQLASGASNLVVNQSVRTLPPTVRVLPPQSHHSTRPAVQLSSVNVSSASNVLVSKGVNVGVTSHVPRGLAAGASLAMRPVAPSAAAQQPSNQGGPWGGGRGRSALVYGPRPRALPPHSTVVTLTTSSPLNSGSVISGAVRGSSPRPAAPPAAARPLPLLQRNYQPSKVVGVGNSAPTQLYYEVPRALRPVQLHAHQHTQTQVNVINTAATVPDNRLPQSNIQTTPAMARPTILRKRDVDGSPTKPVSQTSITNNSNTNNIAFGGIASGGGGLNAASLTGTNLSGTNLTGANLGEWSWEEGSEGGGGSAGSTTVSAASSPARDEELELHEPRKKPRKQLLSNEVRQCEFPSEDSPSSPPTITINPPPKRPALRPAAAWRGTALHFTRPADVRARARPPRDLLAIAAQKHVLTSADGWKVHHLTAQMDDLMSLESDVGSQLAGLLRTLETASGKALSALQPQSHTLLELLKGNIQRSKIVCESIQEAREDILRVFTHRKSVSDILARQADKRCFRKHRSQS